LPAGTPQKEPLNDVAFSPVAGDTRLATIDQSGMLQIWNWQAEQAAPISTLYEPVLSNHALPEWMEDIQPRNTVQWHPDSEQLVALQQGVASILRIEGDKLSRLKLPLIHHQPALPRSRLTQLQMKSLLAARIVD